MGKLTAVQVRNLREPGRYSDGEGLILKFFGSGRGSWIVRVQADGKRRDIGLGTLAEVGLAEAREAARGISRDMKNGVNIVVERKKEREEVPTFKAAAELVHEEHKAGWKNGKHQQQWMNTLETYAFPKIGKVLVSDIEGPAIRDVLAPIWLTKPETARRVRQRIGAVLDWAYSKGYRASEAPIRSLAKGLPRQPKKRGHFEAMPYEEVPDFIAELRSRVSIGRLALEFLILTATRSGEARGCTWSEFDLKKGLWTIPAERMKAGKAHVVPLTTSALDALARVRLFRSPASDFVFQGQNPKKTISDMTLLKIMRDRDSGVTIHGFRSSFRDWAAENSDMPGEVAEAALAHTVSNKVEAAYRRTNYLEKRKVLISDWTDFCMGKIPAEQRQMLIAAN
ncbi:MAG: tyrosine-type recombinase/integrase [Pseudomonadota bacterium]